MKKEFKCTKCGITFTTDAKWKENALKLTPKEKRKCEKCLFNTPIQFGFSKGKLVEIKEGK